MYNYNCSKFFAGSGNAGHSGSSGFGGYSQAKKRPFNEPGMPYGVAEHPQQKREKSLQFSSQ